MFPHSPYWKGNIRTYIWKPGSFRFNLHFFAEYGSDDRYAVAHNVNDYEDNDEEPTTNDYSKKNRNYYRYGYK